MKTCTVCGIGKPLADFHKHPKMADGHFNQCKECQHRRNMRWRRDNPAKSSAHERSYRAQSAHFKVWQRLYSAATRGRQYNSNGQAQARYRATAHGKAYYRLQQRIRRARKHGAVAIFSSLDWQVALAAFGASCVYCGTTGVPLYGDHFYPLSKGGDYVPGNVVPACKSCNSRKGAKLPEEFCTLDSFERIVRVLFTLG